MLCKPPIFGYFHLASLTWVDDDRAKVCRHWNLRCRRRSPRRGRRGSGHGHPHRRPRRHVTPERPLRNLPTAADGLPPAAGDAAADNQVAAVGDHALTGGDPTMRIAPTHGSVVHLARPARSEKRRSTRRSGHGALNPTFPSLVVAQRYGMSRDPRCAAPDQRWRRCWEGSTRMPARPSVRRSDSPVRRSSTEPRSRQ